MILPIFDMLNLLEIYLVFMQKMVVECVGIALRVLSGSTT